MGDLDLDWLLRAWPCPQRQDSLTEQMQTVAALAVQVGCYDAHDWIVRFFPSAVSSEQATPSTGKGNIVKPPAEMLREELKALFERYGVAVGVGLTDEGVAIRSQDPAVDAINIGTVVPYGVKGLHP